MTSTVSNETPTLSSTVNNKAPALSSTPAQEGADRGGGVPGVDLAAADEAKGSAGSTDEQAAGGEGAEGEPEDFSLTPNHNESLAVDDA
jgi:hypothetical protein